MYEVLILVISFLTQNLIIHAPSLHLKVFMVTQFICVFFFVLLFLFVSNI